MEATGLQDRHPHNALVLLPEVRPGHSPGGITFAPQIFMSHPVLDSQAGATHCRVRGLHPRGHLLQREQELPQLLQGESALGQGLEASIYFRAVPATLVPLLANTMQMTLANGISEML